MRIMVLLSAALFLASGCENPSISPTGEEFYRNPPGVLRAISVTPESVALEWDGSPEILTTYNVYRWCQEGELVIGERVKTASFVDTTVTAGTPYLYWVTEVNISRERSRTNELEVWVPFHEGEQN